MQSVPSIFGFVFQSVFFRFKFTSAWYVVALLAALQAAGTAGDGVFPTVSSKKGLQVEFPDDAVALGVKHAVFNLNISQVLTLQPEANDPSWQYQGTTYRFSERYLWGQDHKIRTLSESGAIVYLVVLAYQSADAEKNRLLLHPEYNEQCPNRLGAFNVATDEARDTLSAILQYLAHRWSGRDLQHGRVHGYIMGNEVNSHWWWSNQGETTLENFVDDYVQVMKLASEAVTSGCPGNRVYVSLDHFWNRRHQPTQPLRCFSGKRFLETFAARARTLGDFEWHVAFHPYPENLFDPRFWEDATAIRSYDSPRITFRNLEVLTAFMRRPEMLHRGQPRRIILSEQGFHSTNSPEGEILQAAAYCYAYRRVTDIDGIDALILHRHVDHPREGGLNLGLRRRTPGEPDPMPAKRIYECFRAADQPGWEQTFEFALPVVGLQNWNQARAVPFSPDAATR